MIAWIGTALIFQRFVFKGTALGLLIGSYLVTGLSLASWSQLIVVWFKDASTLAAIFSASSHFPEVEIPKTWSAESAATFLAIVFNLIAIFLRVSRSSLQLILTFLFPPMFFTFYTKALVGWERSNPREPMRLNRVGPEGDAPIAYLLIIAIVSALSHTCPLVRDSRVPTRGLGTDCTGRHLPLPPHCRISRV